MWDAPLYLEYAGREKMRELARQVRSARPEARLQPSRPCGLRRNVARRLVSLGLYLDPQARLPEGHSGHYVSRGRGGRTRLASR